MKSINTAVHKEMPHEQNHGETQSLQLQPYPMHYAQDLAASADEPTAHHFSIES